ncbi:MAG: glycine oxidase ThiO [Solirubrobacteraceae bacterium]
MVENDVTVVGGGVIGLSVAWRCAQQGLSVRLLERGRLGGGATHVAAGMLAPVAEADHGADARRLLELLLRSAERWPGYAAELGVGLQAGSLLLARGRDAAEALEREVAFREHLGLDVKRLRASEARALEPALAPSLRLAALAAEDRSVDPRALVQALARAARAAGAELREGAEVESLAPTGVRLRGGEELDAGAVVLAAGAWSAELASVPVRPVKGQIARLRDRAGAGLLRRVLRYEGGYVVPRSAGGYVLGASVEERGFDTAVTAGVLHSLLRDAAELLPGILELELTEFAAGLRPGTPDNLPLVGRAPSGLLLACGHFRNGILLAPLAAEQIVAELAGVAA